MSWLGLFCSTGIEAINERASSELATHLATRRPLLDPQRPIPWFWPKIHLCDSSRRLGSVAASDQNLEIVGSLIRRRRVPACARHRSASHDPSTDDELEGQSWHVVKKDLVRKMLGIQKGLPELYIYLDPISTSALHLIGFRGPSIVEQSSILRHL